MRLKHDNFDTCNISDNISYYNQTWQCGRLMDAPYAHARVDDLVHDARSQWVDKGKKNQRCVVSATKQAIRIKLATTEVHFLRYLDLDVANVYMSCSSCLLHF